MTGPFPLRRIALLALGFGLIASDGAIADTVVLKNGIVYQGTVDRDDTIVWIFDGLKRIVVRNSKVAKIQADAALRNFEVFRVEQPLLVHTGVMPKEVIRVHAAPWNEKGRRAFEFEGSRIGKVFQMEQAINELGPYMVRIRGVDGFWRSQISTQEIPREIVLAILAKVNRTVETERFRPARFLIQAGWFDDAGRELDYLAKAFPEDEHLKERIEPIRASIVQLKSIQTRTAIDLAKKAGQPKQMETLVKSIEVDKVSSELADAIGEISRNLEAQAAADQASIDELKALSEKLTPEQLKAWSAPLDDLLSALNDAPDAVRDSLAAWRSGTFEGDKSPEEQFALALSGFAVGTDAASKDLVEVKSIWELRELIRKYLADDNESTRLQTLSMIESVALPTEVEEEREIKKLDVLSRLSKHMPPPLSPMRTAKKKAVADEKPSEEEKDEAAAEKTDDEKKAEDEKKADVEKKAEDDKVAKPEDFIHRHEILEEGNEVPTEYFVSLPPEYHPLRSYPAVVALHDGTGPKAALDWWSAEAAKRGYIVIAPEYLSPGQRPEYQYSDSEHAAVILALRDAKKHYAIDSDRVFLGGQLIGANMTWDFSLAHPDLLAGAVVISGMPFKYVNRYLGQTRLVPLYLTLGDLVPAANEVVFGEIVKPMIIKGLDVTYVEYLKRGPETFQEETSNVFDWMDRRRREAFPKVFEVNTARLGDNRFFGFVVDEFDPKRMAEPAGVDGFGKGLNPATIKMKTSAMSNLLSFETSGVRFMDVWIAPELIDFKKRFEVRVNGKSWYKDMAKPEVGMFLEDLRIRGDRQQMYWYKISSR